jgi:hypothetical protein
MTVRTESAKVTEWHNKSARLPCLKQTWTVTLPKSGKIVSISRVTAT